MTISFQDLLKIKNFIKNSKDQSGKKNIFLTSIGIVVYFNFFFFNYVHVIVFLPSM